MPKLTQAEKDARIIATADLFTPAFTCMAVLCGLGGAVEFAMQRQEPFLVAAFGTLVCGGMALTCANMRSAARQRLENARQQRLNALRQPHGL